MDKTQSGCIACICYHWEPSGGLSKTSPLGHAQIRGLHPILIFHFVGIHTTVQMLTILWKSPPICGKTQNQLGKFFSIAPWMPSVLWHCWLGDRKGIRPVKNLSGGLLVWLSVWIEVQTCIWSSWCHCHSLSLASVKSRLVLPFWYWLTWVVAEKGPLNGFVGITWHNVWS